MTSAGFSANARLCTGVASPLLLCPCVVVSCLQMRCLHSGVPALKARMLCTCNGETGMWRPGTGADADANAGRAATAQRAGRAAVAAGFDGMLPLVRVIKCLTSSDSGMDSFAVALGLLRYHPLQLHSHALQLHYSLHTLQTSPAGVPRLHHRLLTLCPGAY